MFRLIKEGVALAYKPHSTAWLVMAAPTFRQVPLSCPGHTRPVVYLHFSDIDGEGKSKFITASKGIIS